MRFVTHPTISQHAEEVGRNPDLDTFHFYVWRPLGEEHYLICGCWFLRQNIRDTVEGIVSINIIHSARHRSWLTWAGHIDPSGSFGPSWPAGMV